MPGKNMSLTTKIFAAIALTGTLIVATMASLIAINMQQGFALYLVQGELNRFDDLEKALSAAHNPATPGWPELSGKAAAWRRFVGDHFHPVAPESRLDQDARTPRKRSDPSGVGDPLQISQRISLLDAGGQVVVGSQGNQAVVLKRPILAAGQHANAAPIGWIGLSAPQGGEDTTNAFFLRGQYTSLLFSSLAALALSAIAAFFLARQFLAPIKTLAAGAKTMASGNYAARMANARRDELGDLIEHYNALAASLEAAEVAQRQWISDTSHELQTPLAVLRAEIEAIQDGVQQASEATLDEMHAAVMRLSRLVGDLKTLSFSREGQFIARTCHVDLAELVEEAVSSQRGRIEAAGLGIHCQADQRPLLTADPMRLRQVIDNLLENALRYTEAPGEIQVHVSEEAGQAVLTIEDSLPSPPESALPHLFERFFRAEASRSRELGGSGLGLAICQAIVAAHAGSIASTLSSLGGLQVRITLPMDAPHDA
jgi:two-component system sensor histidine kinase BaeS